MGLTKKDVVIGAYYLIRKPSGFVVVRIEGEVPRTDYPPRRNVTHWNATNMTTGRNIEIKSASKLRERVEISEGKWKTWAPLPPSILPPSPVPFPQSPDGLLP